MNRYRHTHISCISAQKYKRIWTFISVCICTMILTYMSRYKRLYLCISDLLYTQDINIHISRLYLLKNINVYERSYLFVSAQLYTQDINIHISRLNLLKNINVNESLKPFPYKQLTPTTKLSLQNTDGLM